MSNYIVFFRSNGYLGKISSSVAAKLKNYGLTEDYVSFLNLDKISYKNLFERNNHISNIFMDESEIELIKFIKNEKKSIKITTFNQQTLNEIDRNDFYDFYPGKNLEKLIFKKLNLLKENVFIVDMNNYDILTEDSLTLGVVINKYYRNNCKFFKEKTHAILYLKDLITNQLTKQEIIVKNLKFQYEEESNNLVNLKNKLFIYENQ